MGADGGTVPKRGEQIRTKKRELTVERRQALSLHRQDCLSTCALTSEPLAPPNVVVGPKGQLFNMETAFSSFLDPEKRKALKKKHGIRSTKDMIRLDAKWNDQFLKNSDLNESSSKPTTGLSQLGEEFHGPFICPITSEVCEGTHRFVVVKGCGHVFSLKALKEIGSIPKHLSNPSKNSPKDNNEETEEEERDCLVCAKPFKAIELIEICPINEENSETSEGNHAQEDGNHNNLEVSEATKRKKRSREEMTTAPETNNNSARDEHEQQAPNQKRGKSHE